MRTLTFEQIADSRFIVDTEAEIKRIQAEITANVAQLHGVTLEAGEIRLLDGWGDGTHQHRQTYLIRKEGRKTTWDNVMEAVNQVRAPYYRFI